MPFTMPHYRALSAEETNPFHAAFQTAMRNFAAGNDLETQGIKNKYLPLTTQAEAASKLAYANLMGPQFLAKVLGNENLLANLDPEQQKKALNLVYNAGSGQGTGNQLLNNPSVFSKIMQLMQGQNQPNAAQQNQLPGNQAQQAQAYGMQGQNQPFVNQNQQMNQSQMAGENPDSGYAHDAQGRNIVASPEEIRRIAFQNERPKSFFETSGEQAGLKEEGKEAGKIRARNINDLSDQVFSGQTRLSTLGQIGNMLTSPVFEQIRQLPILGHSEFGYYKNYGTPEQKEAVGQYIALTGNVIKEYANDFKGAFRAGEQALLNETKPSTNDTVDSAKGKVEALMTLTKLLTERSRLTASYMQRNHMSKLDAEALADKQLNADHFRREIHNTLYPKATDEDIRYMAEKYKLSEDEVKKRLKAKGKL